MAFLPNIPQATDQLAISQGNILNNFSILGAIAGNANASSGSINASSGFNWVYLPPQAATPPAGSAFAVGNVAIYSASNATSTQNELYINRQNAGPTTVQIPMTASIFGINNNPGAESEGWSYLPSGLILQWGTTNSFAGAGQTQTINFLIPFPTACIQVTPGFFAAALPSVQALFITAIAPNQFTIKCTAPLGSVFGTWIAIGY